MRKWIAGIAAAYLALVQQSEQSCHVLAEHEIEQVNVRDALSQT